MPDNREIGRRLGERRRELNMTQEELGKKLSVTGTAVSRWESGTNGLSASDLPAVARALYVPATYFLDEDPSAENDPDEIVGQPLEDAIYIAESKGVPRQESIEGARRWVLFNAEEEARRRGAGK